MNQINGIKSRKKLTFFYFLILVDVFLSVFATKLSFYLRKPSRSQLLDKRPDNIWNFTDFRQNRISYFVLERIIASFIVFCAELYAIMMEYLYYDFHFYGVDRKITFLSNLLDFSDDQLDFSTLKEFQPVKT